MTGMSAAFLPGVSLRNVLLPLGPGLLAGGEGSIARGVRGVRGGRLEVEEADLRWLEEGLLARLDLLGVATSDTVRLWRGLRAAVRGGDASGELARGAELREVRADCGALLFAFAGAGLLREAEGSAWRRGGAEVGLEEALREGGVLGGLYTASSCVKVGEDDLPLPRAPPLLPVLLSPVSLLVGRGGTLVRSESAGFTSSMWLKHSSSLIAAGGGSISPSLPSGSCGP